MKRLAIFVFYDKDGIVDDYVTFLLEQLSQNTKDIITLVNGKILDSEKDKLIKYSSKVIIRENKGLDAAAYKQGLLKEVGIEKCRTYDEIILVNDTFFGPFIPLKNILEEMENRKVDFFGLSTGGISIDGYNKVKYGYIPEHIQTFFIAFSKRMVESKIFYNYWSNYDDNYDTFIKVVTQHELIMTKYFSDRGFTYDVYSKTIKFSSNDLADNYNIYAYTPYQALNKFRLPIIKRKTFSYSLFDQHYLTETDEEYKCIEYVRKNYPDFEPKIWKNILRLYNISDLYNCMHLNDIIIPTDDINVEKACVLIHLKNNKIEDYVFELLSNLKKINIFLVVDYDINRELPNNFNLLSPLFVESDMAVFLEYANVLYEKHEYILFIHDNIDDAPTLASKESFRITFENLANNEEYITTVINQFDKEKYLGIIGSVPTLHYNNFFNIGNMWNGTLTKINELLKDMNIDVAIEETKSPILIDGCFWARKKVLDKLINSTIEPHDFVCDVKTNYNLYEESTRRIIPYIAQSSFYYTKTIVSKEYAQLHMLNQQYLLDKTIKLDREKLGCTSNVEAIYYSQKINQLNLKLIQNINGKPLTPDILTSQYVLDGVSGKQVIAHKLKTKHNNFFTRIILKIFGLGKY